MTPRPRIKLPPATSRAVNLPRVRASSTTPLPLSSRPISNSHVIPPCFSLLSSVRGRIAAAAPPTTPIRLSSSSSSPSSSPPPATETSSDSSSSSSPYASPETPEQPPARWVSDICARVGKCLSFGCDEAQVETAAHIMGVVAKQWHTLVPGSEGFVAGRRGFSARQPVAWGEMDSFGHVNNVNYIRYAESSRVNWIREFALADPKHAAEWESLMTPKGVGLIMKAITAEYKFPMQYPDTISVYHKLRRRPEATDTSLVLDCMILSHRHRRVAARTAEDVVIYDYRAARKTTLPADFALEGLRDRWQRQEMVVRAARGTIWGLLKRTRALELATWDREGAVEDLGSALLVGAGGLRPEEMSGMVWPLEDDFGDDFECW